MGFYKNVSLGFALLLIILLGIMAILMSDKSNSKTYPAQQATCPDFYSLTPQNSCVMTESVYSSREPECKTLFPNNLSTFDKKLWANSCGVAWDGITNISINSSII